MSDAALRDVGDEALELTYERVFDAPRPMVFDAWTKPGVLARWWGPKSITVPKVELDVHEGGTWSTVMRSPEGNEYHVAGVYKEIEPPSRLVFTWAWVENGKRGHESTVTVEFEEQGDKTLMRFHQGAFADAEQAAKHDHGWRSTWESLDAYLAGATA